MNEERIEKLERAIVSLTEQIRELREIVQADYAPSGTERDPLYHEAVDVIREAGMASPALLGRKLKVSYSRAVRLVDELEKNLLIEPADGAKPRKLIISNLEY